MLICSIIGFALHGWAVMLLWGWFIVPLFHLPAITFAAGVGLALFTRYATYQYNATNLNNSEEDNAQIAIMHVVLPAVVMLTGWIIHLFV